MSKQQNKSTSFFQELKRRNVYRVLAMYAGAAFVIIELTNNVVDPLRLPPWLPTVVILLLIVGFPVTAILSWIFDLTPEGIKKTGPLEEEEKHAESGVKPRRRLKASDLIIGVLIIAVIVLIYPKIFSQDSLKEVRDSKGKVPLAVLPFENLTGDSLLNFWQGGLQDLLITGLSNSEELSVRQYQSTNSVVGFNEENYASLTPRLREFGSKLELRTVIQGSIMKAGSKVRMDAQIMDTESSEIHQTFRVQGSSEEDFFLMVDSLSWLIKNYVEIKNIKEKSNSSIVESVGYTRSSEAFKYYIHGMDANMNMDMAQSAEWLSRAVEQDSAFIAAQVMLAHAYHMNNQEIRAREVITHIYQKKDQLPLTEKLYLEHLNAYFFQTPVEEMTYAKQLVELDEMNPMYLHMLAVAHYKIFEYSEAAVSWEKLFELQEKWGSEWQNPFAYFMLADAYFELGEYEKEADILEKGLRLFPENGYLQTYRVILALVREDASRMDDILDDYLAFRHNVTNCPEALISSSMGYVYTKAGRLDEAEKHYYLATEQDPRNPQYQLELAKFLIDEDIQVDEGLEIVERLLERFPNHWALLSYKGWGLYKKERYEEALELLKAGWENKPLYNHLYYLHLQEAEEAINSSNFGASEEG